LVKIGTYLYVGGKFTTAGTINFKNIAKFNLQTNTWEQIASPPYEGPQGEIYTLYYSPSRNKLFVWGNFSSIGSYITKNFAIYDLNTNQWLPNSTYLFNSFNNIVNHIDEKGDYIVVGGNFTQIDGSGYNDKYFYSIALHDNSTNTWLSLGTDNRQWTSGLLTKFIIDNIKIYLVGEFDNVNLLNSIESKNIAILSNNPLISTEKFTYN